MNVYTIKGWDEWNDLVVGAMIYTNKDVKQLEENAVKQLEELAEKDPEAAERERDRIWRAIQEIAKGS